MNKFDPFITCPVYETQSFILRLIDKDDTTQLLGCYSNIASVRFMNADNCLNDFYYPTPELMQKAVDFWIFSYQSRYFIRFTILDKTSGEAIGTVEIFGGGCGVLRIDIAAAYEKSEYLKELYQLADQEFFTLFSNEKMVTKAIAEAVERRKALEECGWNYVDQFRVYHDYYEKLANHLD